MRRSMLLINLRHTLLIALLNKFLIFINHSLKNMLHQLRSQLLLLPNQLPQLRVMLKLEQPKVMLRVLPRPAQQKVVIRKPQQKKMKINLMVMHGGLKIFTITMRKNIERILQKV